MHPGHPESAGALDAACAAPARPRASNEKEGGRGIVDSWAGRGRGSAGRGSRGAGAGRESDRMGSALSRRRVGGGGGAGEDGAADGGDAAVVKADAGGAAGESGGGGGEGGGGEAVKAPVQPAEFKWYEVMLTIAGRPSGCVLRMETLTIGFFLRAIVDSSRGTGRSFTLNGGEKIDVESLLEPDPHKRHIRELGITGRRPPKKPPYHPYWMVVLYPGDDAEPEDLDFRVTFVELGIPCPLVVELPMWNVGGRVGAAVVRWRLTHSPHVCRSLLACTRW